MKKTLILFALLARGAFGADWTVNDPLISTTEPPEIANVRGRPVIKVALIFRDDAVTPNEKPGREPFLSANARTAESDIREQASEYQLFLNELDKITDHGVTLPPIEASQRTIAIAAARQAIQDLDTLRRWQAFLDADGTDNIGASNISFNVAKSSTEADIGTNVTNAATLTTAVENLGFPEFIVTKP